MRKIFLSVFATLCLSIAIAQKPLIEPSIYSHWPSAGMPSISNNGKYAMYTINNQPQAGATLVIKAINDKWEKQMPGIKQGQFSIDSRFAILLLGKDSLCLMKPGTEEIEYISNVRSYKLPSSGKGDWLVYQLTTGNKDLIVRNLSNGWLKSFPSVSEYSIINNEDGLRLLLQSKQEKSTGIALQWVDITADKNITIWEGTAVHSFIFDQSGSQVAFIAESPGDSGSLTSIFYYKIGMLKAESLTDSTSYKSAHWELNDLVSFNHEGTKLFFNLHERNKILPQNPKAVKLDIWGYEDPQLQSLQFHGLADRQNTYSFILDIKQRKTLRLQYENESIISPTTSFYNKDNTNFLLVLKSGTGDILNEWNWNKTALNSLYLVSTADGTRRMIKADIPSASVISYHLSPSGKYIIYYDALQNNYFSYTVSSGAIHNITKNVPAIWTTFQRNDEPLSAYERISEARWTKNDEAVLISDQNDIFKIDPSATLDPVNLTNGYGRKNSIMFRLIGDQKSTVDLDHDLLLSAFNRKTKDDGFFQITSGKQNRLECLTMQPYMFVGTNESEIFGVAAPIKAKDTNVYFVRRMSAEESPNYFITSDFKHFSPLTDIHPEQAYNWITTELITWNTFNGTPSQGILYKPQNFDPHVKYPIIFYYYEKYSSGLHGFIKPELSGATIDIPFYVSNGYLVFVPDIHYTIGFPGRSAFNSVVSAAQYLSQKHWVDSRHMGIQGHSFGGFETNYIVTHTNIFAAACSASGWADFISAYNSLRYPGGNGSSRQFYYEKYRERMGVTLWEKPDLYIENSPVFRADKTTAPLLMMNNQLDYDIPFVQGMEFFLALRRLHKKVWLLEYNEEGHVISDNTTALDFNIRMKQFFDHFLKNAPIPKWMAEGIPAELKGIELGYDLEPRSSESGKSSITENKAQGNSSNN